MGITVVDQITGFIVYLCITFTGNKNIIVLILTYFFCPTEEVTK